MNRGKFRLSHLKKSSVVIMLVLAFLILFAVFFYFIELQSDFLRKLFIQFCVYALISGLSFLSYTIIRNSSNLRDINRRIYRLIEMFLFGLAGLSLTFSVATAGFATVVISNYLIRIGKACLYYINYGLSQLITAVLTNSVVSYSRVYSNDLIVFQIFFETMMIALFVSSYFSHINTNRACLNTKTDSKEELLSIIGDRKVFVDDLCLGKPSKISLGVLYKPLP